MYDINKTDGSATENKEERSFITKTTGPIMDIVTGKDTVAYTAAELRVPVLTLAAAAGYLGAWANGARYKSAVAKTGRLPAPLLGKL